MNGRNRKQSSQRSAAEFRESGEVKRSISAPKQLCHSQEKHSALEIKVPRGYCEIQGLQGARRDLAIGTLEVGRETRQRPFGKSLGNRPAQSTTKVEVSWTVRGRIR
jgi:hypothetical protein